MAMVAKANKTLQEALASLLQKHRLQPQDVFVTMVSTDCLGMVHFAQDFLKSESSLPIPFTNYE